jgi:heat-inducible transcriptional repressor
MKEFASDTQRDTMLDQRAQSLLKTLINLYLEDGKPVGSRTLSKISKLNLSAASIRNIMADLEELSLLQAPHHSAGRIPTEQGYRFFIDKLLELRPLSAAMSRRIQQALAEENLRQIIKRLAEILSQYSHLVALVSLPKHAPELKEIDFHRLSDGRLLLLLHYQDGVLEHRLLSCVISADTEGRWQQLAQLLNAALPIPDFVNLPQTLSEKIHLLNLDVDCLTQIFQQARQQRAQARQADMALIMAGQNHVVDFFSEQSETGKANLQRLKELLQLLETRQEILRLLDQSFSTPVWTLPWQVRLGHEHNFAPLQDCSLIAAPYLHRQSVGLLAILGPMRMPYDRLIPLLHSSAERLTSALKAEDLPLY